MGTGLERTAIKGHTGPIVSVALSADGKTIASGSSDYSVKVWDVATGKEKVLVIKP